MDKLTGLTIVLLKLALANTPQGSRFYLAKSATAISEGNETLLTQTHPWFQADFTVAVRHYVTLTLYRSEHQLIADPSGRAVLGVDLRPLAWRDQGFESHRVNGCLSVVSVVYCQVEISTTS